MRTVLTLDEDVAARLKAEMQRSGQNPLEQPGRVHEGS